MPQTIVVDTSSLISVFEERVNMEEQLRLLLGSVEIVVPSAVRHELDLIDSQAARAAADLCARYGAYECVRKGDDGVVEAAEKLNAYAVVTNDSGLADRLVASGMRVLRLKGRKRFGFYRSNEVQ